MVNLRSESERLIKFAKENDFSESFSQIYFVEQKDINFFSDSGLHQISRGSILTFESYENRFDKLLNQGHSWINIHLAGMVESSLIVVIEFPNYENIVPREFVSVNLSLPEKRIIENNWRVEPFYKIVD